MDITYYIRNNNNDYTEFCNSATIKLKKDNKTYYGGVQWGHHEPSDIVDFIKTDCNQLQFNTWLQSLGYEIIIEEPAY
jgi:hypothetical protein